jgi:hypothetical protein
MLVDLMSLANHSNPNSTCCRMENTLTPCANNDGNSEAYVEGQEWEFPLSDSLEDLDNLTLPQVWHAAIVFCCYCIG